MSFGDIAEAIKESSQAVSRGILGDVVRHILEQRESISFHHSEFEEERRIESGVGILLKGEDPTLFATADTGPTAYCVLGRGVAIFIVAHDATQESIVGSGDPVVIVDMESGQRRDIHLEDAVGREPFAQYGVETMNTLDDEHIILVEA